MSEQEQETPKKKIRGPKMTRLWKRSGEFRDFHSVDAMEILNNPNNKDWLPSKPASKAAAKKPAAKATAKKPAGGGAGDSTED